MNRAASGWTECDNVKEYNLYKYYSQANIFKSYVHERSCDFKNQVKLDNNKIK